MELLYDLVMNIYYNLYSYTIYIIIGIVIYLSVLFLHFKLKLSEKATKIIIILLAMFLPICSCVSITFLLYNKIVKDEKLMIALYLLSVYFNIPAMILLKIYIGNLVLIMYILILFITLIVILNFVKDNNLKKEIVENKQYTITFSNELNYLSKFVFIHFIGILIMSAINILFKSVQYIDILNEDKNILLIFFDNVILNYSCIPNDIQNFVKFIYKGYSIFLIMPILFFSTIINIPELLLLFSRLKSKIKLFITIIVSSSLISLLFFIFDNNDMIGNISINYDDRLYKVANLLNVNPSNFFRIISIIIYIVLVLYYSQKKGELRL